jgi:putative ABC transport system permease protein
MSDVDRELNVILAAAQTAHPRDYDRSSIGIAPLAETFFGPIRRTLVILGCAVVLLLLVACGNVSNLLLLRATERKQEIAVRTALGGTTARLARQLMTESVLLALAGGVAAWPVASALSHFLVALAPPELPRLANVALDGRVIVVAVGLVLLSAVLFGLAPMMQALRGSIADRIQGATRHTEKKSTWTLRAALVAGNVAMAAILLVGSGLLIRSLASLLSVDLGFSTHHVLTARLDAGGPRFSTPDNDANVSAATTLFDDVLTRVRALPGVESAAAVTLLPLSGDFDGYGLHIPGRLLANPESAPSAERFVVTPGFAETLGIKLLKGRLLDDRDRRTAPASVVVSEKLAREVFAGDDPLGRQVVLGGPDGPPRTIVGVVGDIHDRSVDRPPDYQIYVPQAQWMWAETDLTFVVRAASDPSPLAGQIRAIVKDVDPAQPLTAVELYDDIVARSTATRRVAGLVIALFAVAALTLAIVGLVGALGVVARQRSREIGVRMALGANARVVASLIIKQGMRPAMLGLLAGLSVAALSAGMLSSLLYGVNEIDPITFAGVALVLSVACVCACAVPAWRASHADVVGALRTP